MDVAQRIRQLAEEQLTNPAHFVVDVVLSLRRTPKKITVILDGDDGISVEDCAELNRTLSVALDKEDVFEDSYLLEVTSPGLDQPLRLLRQYRKNIGRKVRVKGTSFTAEGVLKAVTDQGIVLQAVKSKKETADREIPFTEIEKTIVLVSFN
ncbi:MAG: ribosome maturation factor RimP [Cyclobacteriaceae bacterium]|nr:ribosome maturation factor RimP [Cyclobacteriaceae bacterium]MCX7636413.1 ribosome maturation factor RimP [Cyclobacteriaceae bacterium]MDW8330856.1 ribosome maturation factor RimP [Cyclobacteriaceae bacterium]